MPSRAFLFTPRPFRPPLWARNPHVQTLVGKFLRPRPPVPLRRERWETPDGDFLLLDFADEGMDSAPAVLLLHGLEGSALKPYALLSYQALRRRGLAAVGMNFRSCGGEPNRLARSYHSGETGDPRWVLERLRARWPDRRLGTLAFSIGGNVLMKLLGDAGEADTELVQAAAVVSVPFDLSEGADALERGPMARAYARHFLRSLVGKRRPSGSCSRLWSSWMKCAEREPSASSTIVRRRPSTASRERLTTMRRAAPLPPWRTFGCQPSSCTSGTTRSSLANPCPKGLSRRTRF